MDREEKKGEESRSFFSRAIIKDVILDVVYILVITGAHGVGLILAI